MAPCKGLTGKASFSGTGGSGDASGGVVRVAGPAGGALPFDVDDGLEGVGGNGPSDGTAEGTAEPLGIGDGLGSDDGIGLIDGADGTDGNGGIGGKTALLAPIGASVPCDDATDG